MTARAVGGRGSVRILLVAGRVTALVPADHLPHRRVEVLAVGGGLNLAVQVFGDVDGWHHQHVWRVRI